MKPSVYKTPHTGMFRWIGGLSEIPYDLQEKITII